MVIKITHTIEKANGRFCYRAEIMFIPDTSLKTVSGHSDTSAHPDGKSGLKERSVVILKIYCVCGINGCFNVNLTQKVLI